MKRCPSTACSQYMGLLQPSLWIISHLHTRSALQTLNRSQAPFCSVVIFAGLKLSLLSKYSCNITIRKIPKMIASTSSATLLKQFNQQLVHLISIRGSIGRVTQLASKTHMAWHYRTFTQDISIRHMQTSYVYHEHRQIIRTSVVT